MKSWKITMRRSTRNAQFRLYSTLSVSRTPATVTATTQSNLLSLFLYSRSRYPHCGLFLSHSSVPASTIHQYIPSQNQFLIFHKVEKHRTNLSAKLATHIVSIYFDTVIPCIFLWVEVFPVTALWRTEHLLQSRLNSYCEFTWDSALKKKCTKTHSIHPSTLKTVQELFWIAYRHCQLSL